MGIIKVWSSLKIRELHDLSMADALWEVERREFMESEWRSIALLGKQFVMKKFNLSNCQVDAYLDSNKKNPEPRNPSPTFQMPFLTSLILNLALIIFIFYATF